MEKIQELTEKIYREGVEKGRQEAERIVAEAKEQAKQDMASTLFDQLLKDPKYADVYFIQTNACEKNSHEYSVDGVHPDDHGYYLWSKSIEKPILSILAKYGIK